MLSEEMTGRLVNEIRRFLIADAATLSKANDEQLRRRIADIVDHKLVNYRISPQERSRIVRLVFSSIRGMKFDMALRNVVFPEPVPPLIKILYLALTSFPRKSAASGVMEPYFKRW